MTRFVRSDALKGGEQERLEHLVTLWAFGHWRHAKHRGLWTSDGGISSVPFSEAIQTPHTQISDQRMAFEDSAAVLNFELKLMRR